jgi:DNA-binding transcriptional MerR regulator
MAGSGNSEAMVRARPGGRKSAAAFRTISEVAGDLDVAQHVLRFWESKFPQVRPLKRGGGRRYYRPEDVDLLRQIRSLLYDEGYTIKGAQKLLKGQRRPSAGEGEADDDEPVGMDAMAGDTGETGEGRQGEMRRRLARLRNELVALRNSLREALG